MMAAFGSEWLSDTDCSASPSWSSYFTSKQAGFSPLVFACKQERFDKTLVESTTGCVQRGNNNQEQSGPKGCFHSVMYLCELGGIGIEPRRSVRCALRNHVPPHTLYQVPPIDGIRSPDTLVKDGSLWPL